MSQKTILLYGPPFGARASGTVRSGGYTRNMETYLSTFDTPDFTMTPVFHTVRGEKSGLVGLFPVRLIIDIWRIGAALAKGRPDAVHVLAIYNNALPREFFLSLMCALFRVPFIYDIKAGSFITLYRGRGPIYRWAMRSILRHSAAVLIEGETYRSFIKDEFSIDPYYFPNFIPDTDMDVQVPERLEGNGLKVVFAGYCYAGKGVFELVEGCDRLARRGIPVRLTFAGEESPDFRSYLDGRTLPEGLHIDRPGVLTKEGVRDAMVENDIFCFPSRHSGEGHSNAINEAMACGMVIVSTRVGFLETVVSADAGYFLDAGTPEEIERVLNLIVTDRQEARRRARHARERVGREFTSSRAISRLSEVYDRVFAR